MKRSKSIRVRKIQHENKAAKKAAKRGDIKGAKRHNNKSAFLNKLATLESSNES